MEYKLAIARYARQTCRCRRRHHRHQLALVLQQPVALAGPPLLTLPQRCRNSAATHRREFSKEERFFFPHNVDFRGRAYPMHPHLNHLGSDLARGGWAGVVAQLPSTRGVHLGCASPPQFPRRLGLQRVPHLTSTFLSPLSAPPPPSALSLHRPAAVCGWAAAGRARHVLAARAGEQAPLSRGGGSADVVGGREARGTRR
mgnify:CR=1 FL=1